jgi:hypothetical protein
VAASHRAFSFSGTLPGRSPPVNLNRTPNLTPIARPVTLHDVEDVRSLNQLRQDPLFVDMPNGHQSNFIFPPLAEESGARVVPHSLRTSKSRSYRNLRETQTLPLLIQSTSMDQALEFITNQQKVPLYTPSEIIGPEGTPPLFPCQVSSLAPADSALVAWDGMNDDILAVPDQSSISSLSRASEWSTKEDRAHGQESDHPSLRSEDPSVRSGDIGPWWKGQRFLAIFKKVVPHHQPLQTLHESEILSELEAEKNNCREPFRRTWRFYARCMKQKLGATHVQDAKEKEQFHNFNQ